MVETSVENRVVPFRTAASRWRRARGMRNRTATEADGMRTARSRRDITRRNECDDDPDE